MLSSYLTIDWLKLGPALALLLTPISLFHGQRTRFRDLGRELEGSKVRLTTLGIHVIDFGRALLGAWLLVESLVSPPDARGAASFSAEIGFAAVLWLAVMLQTLICKEQGAAQASFAFVSGLVAGYYSPVPAASAILLATVIAAGFRSPISYFGFFTLTTFGAGFLFLGSNAIARIAAITIAALLPLLLVLMFRRRFVLAYRARRLVVDSPNSMSALR